MEENGGADSESASAPSVCAIDANSVHRICSGQVVVDLATAVKELVENSLDAGSTQIEVRLREYGSEMIEVSDNGRGIAEGDFEGIARKHCTSKLREFSDLPDVTTFGFRGEALSSLCALAELSVVTRQEKDTSATRLSYDTNGDIAARNACARERGTTVTVQRLFYALPVRFKQLRKNLKREYARLVQVLQAYCIVSEGVRINCFNQIGDRPRHTVLATAGIGQVRENVLCVFGQKQLQSLVDIVQCSCDEAQQYVCDNGQSAVSASVFQTFRLSGLISQISHGVGRSAPDRQFFFANGRPWAATKLAKAINELYHSFNRHQYPFVVLLIEISERSSVDVNVTPDKRSILIEHERALVAVLLCSLAKAFQQQEGVFSVASELEPNGRGVASVDTVGNSCFGAGALRTSASQPVWTAESLKRRFAEVSSRDERPKKMAKQLRLSQFQFGLKKNCAEGEDSCVLTIRGNEELRGRGEMPSVVEPGVDTSKSVDTLEQVRGKLGNEAADNKEVFPERAYSGDDIFNMEEPKFNEIDDLLRLSPPAPEERQVDYVTDKDGASLSSMASLVVVEDEPAEEGSAQAAHVLQEVSVSCPLNLLAERFRWHGEQALAAGEEGGEEDRAYFKVRIAADTGQAAERELERHISRTSFADMTVVGQFNLGFIVAKLRSDLFIVDQHATDEKYNFERLQRDVRLQHQPLVVAQPLALPPDSEQIVMDNMDVFERNGFKLEVRSEAEPTKRLSLLGVPTSKNWTFGKADIEEMVYMIQEDVPLATLRPSRVRAMFASRACRSSIMIGTALRLAEMRRLLLHMGEMEQPWNCPHGRPTMRHLVDLMQLSTAATG